MGNKTTINNLTNNNGSIAQIDAQMRLDTDCVVFFLVHNEKFVDHPRLLSFDFSVTKAKQLVRDCARPQSA